MTTLDKTTNVLKNIKSAVSAGNNELDAQGLIAAFENAELTPEDDFPLKELTQTSLGMVSFSNDLGAAYLTGGIHLLRIIIQVVTFQIALNTRYMRDLCLFLLLPVLVFLRLLKNIKNLKKQGKLLI